MLAVYHEETKKRTRQLRDCPSCNSTRLLFILQDALDGTGIPQPVHAVCMNCFVAVVFTYVFSEGANVVREEYPDLLTVPMRPDARTRLLLLLQGPFLAAPPQPIES